MKTELIIETYEKTVLKPAVKEGITLTTKRRGAPGILNFSAYIEKSIKIDEGDLVILKVDGKELFKGYIFIRKLFDDGFTEITAYDQFRYFANSHTYLYENKRASEVIQAVCKVLDFETGEIEKTEYIIPARIEENKKVWNIFNNALDMELNNKGNLYVLYDDFGNVCLKKASDMVVDILISESTAQSIDYSSSINNLYNRVITMGPDRHDGINKTYVAENKESIKSFGVLQHVETFYGRENSQEKANTILALNCSPTHTMRVKGCFGHLDVRGGSCVKVDFNIGRKKFNEYMMVESCEHSFFENEHTMTLDLTGVDKYNINISNGKTIEQSETLKAYYDSPGFALSIPSCNCQEKWDTVTTFDSEKCNTLYGGVNYHCHPSSNPENIIGQLPESGIETVWVFKIVAYKGEYWAQVKLSHNMKNYVYIRHDDIDLKNTWDPKDGRWLYIFRNPFIARKVNYAIPLYFNDFGSSFDYISKNYLGQIILHSGVDIVSDKLSGNVNDVQVNDYPVFSVSHGEVVEVRIASPKDEWSYGNMITIKTNDELYIRYAHLKDEPSFTPGDKVTPYTKLGILGKTGDPNYKEHLHFEVRSELGGNRKPNGSELIDGIFNPMYFFQRGNNPDNWIIFTRSTTNGGSNESHIYNGKEIPLYGDPNKYPEINTWRRVTNENCRCNTLDGDKSQCRVHN